MKGWSQHMGLRDFFTRDSLSKEELVAERLCERFEDLNMLSLADMPLRQRVDVCGEIRRMSVKPRAGIPAVEVEISDGRDSGSRFHTHSANL
ncbi:MAG: hypothetical protein EBV42_06370, partial [Actinobacteria bacterium]|nr:hypothetical protein [Actinomycetota bacterium]